MQIRYEVFEFVCLVFRLEMGPDATRAYFWPSRGQPEEIFFDPREKIKKFDIFRGNFPNPNHRWLTPPEQQKIDLTPGQNFLTRTHH